MEITSTAVTHALSRNLVFVHGKGGVGKTAVSQAIALRLSQQGKRTLWIALEDPILPPHELKQHGPHLWHLNCHFTNAFEEYVSIKIGSASLSRIFLQNKLMQYLAKAAPGIRELVLLGKIWFERLHYDHVIVDLPSTGYGLAMFQSTQNFVKLFQGGPLNKDAVAMLETFQNHQLTGHLILALPEEMPLRESLELNSFLLQTLPKNPAVFLVNRVFPSSDLTSPEPIQTPSDWTNPLPSSIEDYARKRHWLERHNLRLWKDEKIEFGELEFIPPPLKDAPTFIVKYLAEQLQQKAFL
jgi:hypothetical protein